MSTQTWLYICRAPENPIALQEWLQALPMVEGVRLARRGPQRRNPYTGEMVEVPLAPGDADVFFPRDRQWRPVLLYREGVIGFPTPTAWKATDPLAKAASGLARTLNAAIAGEDGRFYVLV